MPTPRRSRSTWQSLVRAWRKSKLTAPQFAQRRGIDPQQLRWWAWRLRQTHAPVNDTPASADTLSFIELPPAPRPPDDLRVELVLASGRSLRFPATIEPHQLSRIVAAIEEPTS